MPYCVYAVFVCSMNMNLRITHINSSGAYYTKSFLMQSTEMGVGGSDLLPASATDWTPGECPESFETFVYV